MPIPDYQTIMLPLLRNFGNASEPKRVKDFVESIANEFELTPDELAERIPSGQENLLTNRMAWARTYMGKAGLLRSVSRGYLTITDSGRQLLAEQPARIDQATLRRFPEFVEWIESTSLKKQNEPKKAEQPLTSIRQNVNPITTSAELSTPREKIDSATQEIESALSSELLDRVCFICPSLLQVRTLINTGGKSGGQVIWSIDESSQLHLGGELVARFEV